MIALENIPSPCFVLDESKLKENLERLKYVQDRSGVQIICALKGFAMWSVFSLLKKYLSGGAASSLNEALLIQEELGSRPHTYCPAYLPEEFSELARISQHLTFNSLGEYRRYWQQAKRYNPSIHLGLRINPGYSEITTEIYNPAHPHSRLGVLRSELGDTLPEGIDGLHFHLLCEQDSRVFERVLKKTEEQFSSLFEQCRWINMGGGHLITHKDYDIEHVVQLLIDFKRRYPGAQLILEPGGAIAWQTGYLVSRVLDLIERGQYTIAMLDVSFSAHMPDTLEMPYKPAILGASEPVPGKKLYKLGGVTCLAGDQMGDYSFEKDLDVGDRLIFLDMIHYTMVKTTFFNGVQHPSIGIIREDNRFELIRKFTYQDYKHRLS